LVRPNAEHKLSHWKSKWDKSRKYGCNCNIEISPVALQGNCGKHPKSRGYPEVWKFGKDCLHRSAMCFKRRPQTEKAKSAIKETLPIGDRGQAKTSFREREAEEDVNE
jgi:hypothetical protein